MAGGLNGRVARLEATLTPGVGSDHCRACGLRHATGPMTLAVLRSILRVEGGNAAAPAAASRLCLCEPCCGDPQDQWLARLSHGLDAA